MLEVKHYCGGYKVLEDMVSDLSEERVQSIVKNYDINRFKEIFDNDDMMSTCNSLFENNLNVSATARKMYMHRNTLIYRLNKIKKETGLDVCDFSQAVIFIVLHIIYSTKKNIK
jgi:DNA-binding PucR family transcriptional regulator